VSRGGTTAADATSVLRDLRTTLASYPNLRVRLGLSPSLPKTTGDAFARHVQEVLELAETPSTATGDDLTAGTASIQIEVAAKS
jgi:hypothetical protein